MKALTQILLINILVFSLSVFMQTHGLYLNNILALYPIGSEYFYIYQFITHIFAHGNLEHILSNMILLVIVGYEVESKLGKKETWRFFLLSGLFSSGLYFLGSEAPIIGASGAVFSMITAFILLTWTKEIGTKLFKNLFFISLIVLEVRDSMFLTDDIAHLAHIFGVIFALVYFSTKKITSKN